MKKWQRALVLALSLMLVVAPMTGITGVAETASVYPLETDVKLTIWSRITSAASAYITSLSENAAVIAYQEATGIDVEFIHPISGQETESFNLLIATGTYPDIMCASSYAGGVAAAVLDGVYADLTDYLPDYAPNYWSFVENDPDFRKLASTEEGRFTTMYNYKNQYEPYYYRTQFRQDLLDEFGMEIPLTLDDYEAYFEAVKTNHPEMVPYALNNDGLECSILCAWNIGELRGNGSGCNWYVVDGKAKSGYYAPELKEYLELMHSWYEKGYISTDFITENPSTLFQTGEAASCSINGYGQYATMKELGIPMISGRYARINPEDQIHTLRRYWPNNGGDTYFSGAADEETLQVALRFVDYGYTDDGILLMNFGPKGVTWDEVDEDGFPLYNDNILNNPELPMNNAEEILRLHGTGWARYRYGDKYCMATNQKDPESWAYRERWGDDETVDNTYAMPPFTLSAEADERLAQIMTNVKTHANEMVLKYITGAADLALFDTEYTAVLESFGIQEAIDIYQQGYDTYMAR